MKRIALPSCIVVLVLATAASAATFHVDDTGDAVDAVPGDGACATTGGACTLRAAVQEANALAGPDRIRVPAGTYALAIGGGAEDAAATGDLDLRGRLRIVGAGVAETIIDGSSLDRVFDVQQDARVRLIGLAVTGGKANGSDLGGGVHTDTGARLVLRRVLIEDNQAFGGGGVFASGPLKMDRCTVRQNVASVGGGLATVADATIRASTFDANAATGIALFTGHDVSAAGRATVTVVNSTITGQIETFAYCEPLSTTCHDGADVVLANATVNAVSSVVLARDLSTPYPGSFTLRNTIVQQCGAELISQGYNFVQPEGCVILGDLTGVVVGDDPLLGSLRDNGGPTWTRLPVAVSAAVDGGNPATPGSGGFACEAFDQRGVPRLLGMYCDIGAVEGH